MDYTNAYSLSISMYNMFIQASIRLMSRGFEKEALEEYVNALAWWNIAKQYEKGLMPSLKVKQ